MLEWPRRAFIPPPGMPMLPSSSCTMAPVRIICEPTVCWVQPRAYMMVIALPGCAVSAMASQTLSMVSCGVPQMLLTTSGV
ncbi:hypothetical protein D3C78_1116940 [compost metagenome]